MEYKIEIKEILEAKENKESIYHLYPKKYKYLLKRDLSYQVFKVLKRSYISYEYTLGNKEDEFWIYTDAEPSIFERIVVRAIMELWAKEKNMKLALAKSEIYDGEFVRALMDLHNTNGYAVNDKY